MGTFLLSPHGDIIKVARQQELKKFAKVKNIALLPSIIKSLFALNAVSGLPKSTIGVQSSASR
jgi:hypothetical protein